MLGFTVYSLLLADMQGDEKHIDGLMQKRRNSIANALELRLFCIKPSVWSMEMNSYMYRAWGII